jgi:protocatechuate 3,4-dioxygenase alpha subunit
MSLHASASQTIGPFFHIGLTALNTDKLAPPGIAGERVTIQGRVLDGHGKPVSDAMIEVWQANAQGKYAHPDDPQDKTVEQGFKGFGRIPTDDNGMFRFTTIKPGRVPGPGNTLQAPHLVVSVFMRGLLKPLATRLYFPDEPSNAEDPILKLVPADRRATLTARKVSGGAEPLFEWNVIVQGEGETVFFDC